MKSKYYLLIFTVIPLVCGCFTSMGLFRGANAIGKNKYDFSFRWQTSYLVQAFSADFRYGLTDITDIESIIIGLLGQYPSGMSFREVGIQCALTQQIGHIEFLAIGCQGFLSTFNKYGGVRLLIGKKFYGGYEINYVLDDSFYHEDNFFSHNLLVGQEMELKWAIFPKRYPVICYEIGLQILPFEDRPRLCGGISFQLLSNR